MSPTEPTDWIFPALNGGEGTGFRDAGIALFSTDAIRSMTREVLQNSIDAGERTPVRVTFSRLLVPRTDIPNVDQLRQFIARCQMDAERRFVPVGGPTWIENGGDAAAGAAATLGQQTIPILRIRDENTKGLVGVDDKGGEKEDSNWERLIRKKGSPQGNGPQGGSFGVGQRAPYAAAQLRTVFYGTRTSRGFAFIGKSIWWSIPLSAEDDADRTQNVGYWGRVRVAGARVLAVTDPTRIAGVFRRETQGTDLFLLGFGSQADANGTWRTSVLDAVLINYFAAVHSGRLEVVLDDGPSGPTQTTISKETILDLVAKRVAETAKPVGRKKHGDSYEELLRTQYFLSALAHGECHEGDAGVLGKVRLHVIRKDGAPSRIAWMRSPLMLVTSSTNNTMRDYAAVFVCDDKNGNEKLRTLEGPEHNHWDNKTPERGEIIRDRNDFVRSVLDKMAGLDTVEEQDLPQLSAYLPEELPAGGSLGTGPREVTEHHQPKESGRRVPRRGKLDVTKGRVPPPVLIREQADQGAGVGDGPDGAGGKGGSGGSGTGTEPGGPNPGNGAGDLGEGAGDLPRLRPRDLRYRTWFERDGECTIMLHSRRAGKGDISVRAIGAEGPPAAVDILDAIDLATGNALPVSSGTLMGVSVEPKRPLRLMLRISPPRRAALNLEVKE